MEEKMPDAAAYFTSDAAGLVMLALIVIGLVVAFFRFARFRSEVEEAAREVKESIKEIKSDIDDKLGR